MNGAYAPPLPLRRTVLRRDPLRILMTARHPLASRASLSLRDLDGLSLSVMSDPAVCFSDLRAAFAAQGVCVAYRVIPAYIDAACALRDDATVAIDRGAEQVIGIGEHKVLPFERGAFTLHCCLYTPQQESPAATLLRRYLTRTSR